MCSLIILVRKWIRVMIEAEQPVPADCLLHLSACHASAFLSQNKKCTTGIQSWASALRFLILLLLNWSSDGGRHVSTKCNKKYYLETVTKKQIGVEGHTDLSHCGNSTGQDLRVRLLFSTLRYCLLNVYNMKINHGVVSIFTLYFFLIGYTF